MGEPGFHLDLPMQGFRSVRSALPRSLTQRVFSTTCHQRRLETPPRTHPGFRRTPALIRFGQRVRSEKQVTLSFRITGSCRQMRGPAPTQDWERVSKSGRLSRATEHSADRTKTYARSNPQLVDELEIRHQHVVVGGRRGHYRVAGGAQMVAVEKVVKHIRPAPPGDF